MNKEEMIKMNLHDIVELNMHLTVVKVLGGWIYVFRHPDGGVVSEFISSRSKD